jgi:putative transposase
MAIELDHPSVTIARQCALLGLARSSAYYRHQQESDLNEQLMRQIDQQYLQTPFYGARRMTAQLVRLSHQVNVKRIRRLMRLMGLEALYQKPRLSQRNREHRVYPYLLGGLTVERADQVWCTDITYIPMHRGWLYLVAILDWFSRYVLAWEVSVTLDSSFCVSALERALALGRPEIFNSDQGSQFTSRPFIAVLEATGVRISMDGRRRAYDNIFVERLWRTVKYEEVYLHDYQTVAEAVYGLGGYFRFYNDLRPHQSLGYRTPAEVYGIPGSGPPGGAANGSAAPSVALRAPSGAAASPG